MAAAQPVLSVPPLTAEQIDRLVAPIALYPDPLLAQILIASTYPLEVVEADRWLQVPANAALRGDDLTAVLRQQPWDPSIKSLSAFRGVLRMIDDNLSWTEQLGNAFLAQQADVMDAVQRLRRLAETAGSLASGPQQTVSGPQSEIAIEPVSPETVYVPVYNPLCAFGAWPAPDYPPYSFGTWSGYCVPVLEFGGGIYPSFGFWAWGFFEWRRHHIRIDHNRFAQFHPRHEPSGEVWQHNPAHRHSVPYADPGTAARFLGPAATARREFRGFPATEAAPRAGGVAATPPGDSVLTPNVIRGVREPEITEPPFFQSFGRGADARGDAARGFSSRMSPPRAMPAMPAPSFHAAPPPSFGGGRR